MKRATILPAVLPVLLLVLLATPAGAAPAPYAMQWPLTLASDDAGAYRVTLDESVYRQVATPDLRDLDVLNADGTPVPTSVLDPEQPLARRPPTVPVPWFPLPTPPGAPSQAGGSDWRLVTRVDSDGRLRQVEVEGGAPAAGAAGPAQATALLLDLSRIREPVVALQLQWKPVEALDLGYHVEASDDLEQWRSVPSSGRMVDLGRDGRRLLQRRIQLDGLQPRQQHARYLRLTPRDVAPALEITAVAAEPAGAAAPVPQWLALQPAGAAAPERAKAGAAAGFVYETGGRFPVEQVDVAMPGNHALQWRLESRAGADAPWQLRAGPWMAYRVDGPGPGSQSAPRGLDQPVRDRYWRLTPSGPTGGMAPTLQLGYRPEVVVFLAQGGPPYRLVAGSARARRADSPLPQLVSTLRSHHGAGWQPAPAYLGTPKVLAGPSALEAPRNWTQWLLWAVLALGAMAVGGFALSLLRAQRVGED
ncbi:DUF3999 domain-containing protein [Lysobacter sp. A3-1-A15]|uniref:DUF3999 domain-containing protein n=1 Tax=Novilysobacter viscosus TaxID=3098602 RepID=UPI002ED86D42